LHEFERALECVQARSVGCPCSLHQRLHEFERALECVQARSVADAPTAEAPADSAKPTKISVFPWY